MQRMANYICRASGITLTSDQQYSNTCYLHIYPPTPTPTPQRIELLQRTFPRQKYSPDPKSGPFQQDAKISTPSKFLVITTTCKSNPPSALPTHLLQV
jgi:hypothetical protein